FESVLLLALAEGITLHAGLGDPIQDLALSRNLRAGGGGALRGMRLNRPVAVRLPAGQALELALGRRNLIFAAIAALLGPKGQDRPYRGCPFRAARRALLIAGLALKHLVQHAGRQALPRPQRCQVWP